jgi:hypothetical protein
MLRAMRRSLAFSLALVSVLLFASFSAAQSLRIDQSGERMRVDGALREWKGARFVTLGTGSDASARFALATADGGLYLGAEIEDEQLVRAAGVGARQDALVLTLVMPDSGADVPDVRATELWLHAGQRGQKAAAGLAREGQAPKPEPRIKVVEGPRDAGQGYVIEAFVPWSLIPNSEIWEQGRAALRYEDVDEGTKVESVARSAPATRASELPRIVLGEGQGDLLGAFLSSRELAGVEPRFDFRGNVYGGRAPERVVIVDRFVVMYGPEYKKGEAFGYLALPLSGGGSLKSAVLADVTGDQRDELLVVVRQKNELGGRELWMALNLAGEDPAPLFAIELRKEVSGGAIDNELALIGGGKGPQRIRVQVGKARGLDAASYRENPARDAEAILLPWGEVEARTYQFDGTRFAVVEEKKRAVATTSAREAPEATVESEPEQLEEPTLDALLALVKKELKLPASARPQKQLSANVFGGAATEALCVFGTTLVIAGGDLGDGASYMAYGLPITSPGDFQYLGTGDVTGDGAREIFVRIKQVLSGADGVYRELAMVLRFDELGRFGRALLADVTRRKGASVVANRVRTHDGKLTILPGSSEGWDAESYPFTNEATGGAERLLLPWADGPVSYRLEGGRFVPAR